ncbi:MAG: hypothetical protein AAGF78_07975 [Pseudomonadota bacterium]
MTNRLAIILGLIIVTAVILDQVFNDGVASLFLSKRLLDLIEWLAFWR